jgi:hypothetical protein
LDGPIDDWYYVATNPLDPRRHEPRFVMRIAIAVTCMLLATSSLGAQAAGNSQARSTNSSRAAKFAGSFDTAVEIIANTCGPVTVQPMPTTVSAGASDSSIVLTHAGIAHHGTVSRDGSFSTTEVTLGSGATTYRVSMRGRFATANTFSSTVTVRELTSSTEKCSYRVKWSGTRKS